VTLPRQVVPGRTYLISRRCTQRQYLLRPCARTAHIVLYCLAEAALRYGVTLHAWIVLSNHWHLLVRDDHGRLSEFLAHVHKLIAKAMNTELGRWENFWAAEQCNAVYLVDAAARFGKLVYLLANPVADHLVERVADWPGACSLAQHLCGRPQTVRRPRGHFRADGPMPESVTLVAHRPDGFEHLSDGEWSEKVRQAVRDEEEKARAARAVSGRRVLGRKQVLSAATTERPRSIEPRRSLRPHLACRDKHRRARALAALREFRAAYREARLRFEAGDHAVVFPYGTCRYARLGARCAPHPPP
jgi:hypothetical protein